MNRPDRAYQLMLNSRTNCAQAVLSTYAGLLGLDEKTALSIAQGFGGGIARTGQTCGAVTGAVMVIGLSQKFSGDNARENLDKVYGLTQDFIRKFEALHSTTICSKLIGYDLSNPVELAEVRRRGIFASVCPDMVRDASMILEQLLDLQK